VTGDRAARFTLSSSLTRAAAGEHTLALPGRHEATALTDMCPGCGSTEQPATVLDVVRQGRAVERLASYRCTACRACWLCSWCPANYRASER